MRHCDDQRDCGIYRMTNLRVTGNRSNDLRRRADHALTLPLVSLGGESHKRDQLCHQRRQSDEENMLREINSWQNDMSGLSNLYFV